MSKKNNALSYLVNVFTLRCPRCREGKIFSNRLSIKTKKNVAMNTRCPVCTQPTEIEVGFYYGTGYVSYGITVIFSLLTFLLWFLLIGFSLDDNRILYWFIANTVLLVLLQPWLMRFSRSLWLSWFVKYDADWEHNDLAANERVIETQMEGWQDINKETLE
jgi:hypothetical protein